MTNRSEALIRSLAQQLRGRDDLRLVLLFGSRARGTERPDSDVDLAVWAPGADLVGLAANLSGELGLDVEVLSLSDPDIPLLREIVDHGILVHEGAPGAQGSWRARALSILDLDGPWFARMRDAWLRRVADEGI